MLKLFVSHSSKDHAIVRLLVGLLTSALNLSANEIRCTSVDGYRLPGGANTLEQLRIEVHDAQAFLCIISRASLESMYVAFEMGARWGADKHLLPVLAPGADTNILSGPLSGINALHCGSAAQMHQMIADLATKLGINAEPASVYQHHIDSILAQSPSESNSDLQLQEQTIRIMQADRNSGAVKWEGNAYWVVQADGSKDGPFCQVCYDSSGKFCRLHHGSAPDPDYERVTYFFLSCKVCGNVFEDPGVDAERTE